MRSKNPWFIKDDNRRQEVAANGIKSHYFAADVWKSQYIAAIGNESRNFAAGASGS